MDINDILGQDQKIFTDDGGKSLYFMFGGRKVVLSDEEAAHIMSRVKCGALGIGYRRPETEPATVKFDSSCCTTTRKYEFTILLMIGLTIAAFVLIFFR